MHIIKRLRALPAVPKSVVTRVIVQKWEPLTDNEINSAFKGNETTQWWRSIVQLVEARRSELQESAAAFASQNNALGMAHDVGAHEALAALLIDLEQRL